MAAAQHQYPTITVQGIWSRGTGRIGSGLN
jgi:hypothetical protein